MFAILARFITTVIVFYLIVRLGRSMLGALRDKKEDTPGKDRFARNDPRNDNVIDICPKCGNVKMKNHKCQFKS